MSVQTAAVPKPSRRKRAAATVSAALRGGLLGTVVAAMAWVIEGAVVQDNGGVWVGIAGWLGVIVAARRAGISKWALPLLAYPLISVAIVVVAGERLLHPWGVSWLWLAPLLGPGLGGR